MWTCDRSSKLGLSNWKCGTIEDQETIAQFPDMFTWQNQVFSAHLCAWATETGILKSLWVKIAL